MNNLPQESNDRAIASNNLVKTIAKPSRISAQELHKYVLGLIGIFILVVATYPSAMNRVAQKEKFAPYKSHLKSLTLEYKPSEPQSDNSVATATPAQVVTEPEHTLTR